MDKMVFSWYQGLELGPEIKKSRGILFLLNIMNFLITRAARLWIWNRDDNSFTGMIWRSRGPETLLTYWSCVFYSFLAWIFRTTGPE